MTGTKTELHRFQFLLLLITATVVLAAGCTFTGYNTPAESDGLYLTIQVSGAVPAPSASAHARTIWCADEQETMEFWLYGESRNTSFKTRLYLDDRNNAYTLIEKDDWILTLAAYPAGATPAATAAEAFSQALLIDRCHLDLRRWSASASFTLSTIGIETPSAGNITVTFDAPEALSDFTVTAGIYQIEQHLRGTAESECSLDLSEGEATYSFENVPAGFYYFAVTFTRGFEVYEWREAIQIVPGDSHTYNRVAIMDLIS